DSTLHLGASADQLVQTFSYTVTDGDGDPDTGFVTIKIDDDGPLANPDDGGTVGAGTTVPLAGNVLANDEPGADGAAVIRSVTHDGVTYTLNLNGTTVTATDSYDPVTGVLTIETAEGGTLAITLAETEEGVTELGDYSYTAPPLGIGGDTTESFDYVFEDGDGDRAGSVLTVNLLRPIFAGVLLETNTNQDIQCLRVILTRNDADIFEPTEESPRTGTGQQSLIEFSSGGVEFESGNSYAIILKFEGGSGNTNVTDFDLIFDTTAEPPDAESNIFLTLLGEGNIQLGDQGQSHDGVIWTLEDDGSGFVVTSPAILYDVDDIEIIEVDATTGEVTATAGEILILDSDGPNESFALNFGLLPTIGNVSPPEDSIFRDIGALDGDIEVIDITGSQTSEVNTLSLNAQDVIDVTDGDNELIIMGDNDILLLSDPENWEDDNP
ncbi:MAG: hypothetical protein IH900_03345, partial [Proteobacteria bacterium]|nr:hypothetical protein [Pseudomonadota bacterium]